MQNNNCAFNPSKPRQEERNSNNDKSNSKDHARTVEMLRKLEKLEEKASNNNTLVAADLPIRKSASFQNITEISEDCPVDLGRRGSDPRSMPSNPRGQKGATGGRRQKPWELRRSSTPIPGALDVSSILRKARGRFSPVVGHTSVKENEESDEWFIQAADVEWRRNFVYLVYHFYVICMVRSANILHGQDLRVVYYCSPLLLATITTQWYIFLPCITRLPQCP